MNFAIIPAFRSTTHAHRLKIFLRGFQQDGEKSKRPRTFDIFTYKRIKRDGDKTQVQITCIYLASDKKIINLLLSSIHHFIIRISKQLDPPSISIYLLYQVPH